MNNRNKIIYNSTIYKEGLIRLLEKYKNNAKEGYLSDKDIKEIDFHLNILRDN